MAGRRARLIFAGAVRLVVDGLERVLPRAAVLEFGDTQGLQEGVQSDFGALVEREPGDDTVADVFYTRAGERR